MPSNPGALRGTAMILKNMLGEIFLSKGIITKEQLEGVLKRQQMILEEKIVTDRLSRTSIVTETRVASDVERIPRLGQIIVELGIVTAEQLKEALEEQDKMIEVYRSLDKEKLGDTIEIGSLLNSALSTSEVLSYIMAHINNVTDSIASTLMLLDEATGELVFSVPTGPKADQLTDIRLPPGRGIAGWVAESGESVISNNVQEDPRFYGDIDKVSGFETKSILCVPLKSKTKMIGVLEIVNKRDGSPFTREDELLLRIFANQAAIAIENARFYHELKESRARYQHIFQNAYVSLLEEDIGEARKLIDCLKPEGGIGAFRTFLREHPDHVLRIAENIGVLNANRAALRMCEAGTEREMAGSLRRFFGSESIPALRHEIIAIAEGKEFVETETTLRTLKGKKLYVLRNLMIPKAKEPCKNILVSMVDISDRKLSERLLKQAHDNLEEKVKQRTSELSVANKNLKKEIESARQLQNQLIRSERLAATGQLAASVAHEINSPLQGMASIIDFIKKTYSEDKELVENMDVITKANRNIHDTVRRLLDLNRPGKEKKELTDINVLVEDTLSLVAGHVRKKGIFIATHLTENLPGIIASPQQMLQVIMNLINNSAEAMSDQEQDKRPGEKKEITINSFEAKGKVVIELSDNGPGIPQSELQHIFDPFYTTKRKKGMGIGLSICSSIIESHQGTIEVKNLDSGKGAICTICLPLGH
jgi:signal transduction histidine kinase/putative methionine-R-sulfoxide reductase with GAF domain